MSRTNLILLLRMCLSTNVYVQIGSASIFCLLRLLFLGVKASPRDVASRIKENIEESELIEKIEIAGPGFLNVWISKTYCQGLLNYIITKGVLPPRLHRKQKVIVDFSSPNIAKEMHVGHLR